MFVSCLLLVEREIWHMLYGGGNKMGTDGMGWNGVLLHGADGACSWYFCFI